MYIGRFLFLNQIHENCKIENNNKHKQKNICRILIHYTSCYYCCYSKVMQQKECCINDLGNTKSNNTI